jgi:hypothetical protein
MDIRTLPVAVERKRREALRFLASPSGEMWRRRAGWFLIAALPLVFRIPALRRHWALRLLELAGGAAVLVKLGEAVRDWQPSPSAYGSSNT